MKKIILLAALAASFIHAQVTMGVTGAGATSISLTVSAEAAASLNAYAIQLRNTAFTTQPTLGAAVATTDTTITLSSTTGITADMGILVDSEVFLVTSVFSGTVLVITNAQLGTTAATHLSGTPVTVLQAGGLMQLVKVTFAAAVQQIMLQNPGPTVAGAKSTIQTELTGAVN